MMPWDFVAGTLATFYLGWTAAHMYVAFRIVRKEIKDAAKANCTCK